MWVSCKRSKDKVFLESFKKDVLDVQSAKLKQKIDLAIAHIFLRDHNMQHIQCPMTLKNISSCLAILKDVVHSHPKCLKRILRIHNWMMRWGTYKKNNNHRLLGRIWIKTCYDMQN